MRSTGWAIALLVCGGCFTDKGTTAGGSSSSGEPGTSSTTAVPTTSDGATDTEVAPASTNSSSSTTADPSSTTGPADGDPCDPWNPLCPEGSKCAAWASDGGNSWNANRCVPAGNDPPGQGCTVEGSATSGEDSCRVGAMCWDVDPDKLTGTCFALCEGTEQTPACPIGSTCFSTNEGTVNLCVATCDPLVLDTCDGVCVYDNEQAQFICLLDASGGAPIDGPCDFINGCPAGSACLDPARSLACDQDAGGCCLDYCDLKVADECTAEQTCVSFFGEAMAPPKFDNVGVCVMAP